MKVLCAVDDSKGSLRVIDVMGRVFSSVNPEVVLLYVEKIEGPSVLDDLLLSESEMKELKEAVKDTPRKEEMDRRAEKILQFFTERLKDAGLSNVRALVKMGHPAEEILNTAEEEDVDLIAIGSRGKRLKGLFIGSVSREVVNNSNRSVLVAK